MEDKTKVLKLMRFWLFGTFMIVFAAVTIYAGMLVGTPILREPNYWFIVGSTAVLCVGTYFGYQWWISRKA
jgi:hypothetical protein